MLPCLWQTINGYIAIDVLCQHQNLYQARFENPIYTVYSQGVRLLVWCTHNCNQVIAAVCIDMAQSNSRL